MREILASCLLSTFCLGVCLGCDSVDTGRVRAEAKSLLDDYGPEVVDLLQKSDGLIERLKALPAGPEVTTVLGKLDDHRGRLIEMKAVLDTFPATLDGVLRNARVAEVQRTIEMLREVGGQLSILSADSGELVTWVTAVEESVKRTGWTRSLSTGHALTGSPSGIESQLVAFIEDGHRPADKTTWFDFDRLSFQPGSAELDLAASRAQLVNIAEIMRAYPTVDLLIGAYTDNQGRPEANRRLSAARAAAVASELVHLGVDEGRLSTEGYGADYPHCPANDSEACRSQNRRIALHVVAK